MRPMGAFRWLAGIGLTLAGAGCETLQVEQIHAGPDRNTAELATLLVPRPVDVLVLDGEDRDPVVRSRSAPPVELKLLPGAHDVLLKYRLPFAEASAYSRMPNESRLFAWRFEAQTGAAYRVAFGLLQGGRYEIEIWIETTDGRHRLTNLFTPPPQEKPKPRAEAPAPTPAAAAPEEPTGLRPQRLVVKPPAAGPNDMEQLRQIKRISPTLYEEVRTGHTTLEAAYAEAAARPLDLPLTELKRWWREATPEQRAAFEAWRQAAPPP